MNAQQTMELVLIAVYGLLFGSFYNVVIYRLPLGMNLAKPSSHCTTCGHKLGTLDLIPVLSYAFLGGKCRYCSTHYSFRYTAVEILNSVIWAGLYILGGKAISVELVVALIVFSILLISTFIDIEHHIVLDSLLWVLLIAGVVSNAARALGWTAGGSYGSNKWYTGLISAAAVWIFLFLVSIVGSKVYKTEEALGMGDVYILAPISLVLGWQLTILAVVITFVSGAFFGIIYKKLGSYQYKLEPSLKDGEEWAEFIGLPLVPFIAIASLISYTYGWEIINWYLQVSGMA